MMIFSESSWRNSYENYFLVEQNENLTEALQLIQRVVKAQPANLSFLHKLGWAHFKLGHLDEVERYLSESVRRDGTLSLSHEHLGDIHAQRGNTRQAHEE